MTNPQTHVVGADLLPDFDKLGTTQVLVRHRYWVGVTPLCPIESLDLAGINFPKVNELLVDDPLRTTQRKRIPVIGALVWLTEDKIVRMRERLQRTVIRFTEKDSGQKEEPNTGLNMGDNFIRPKRGHAITIPTPAEIEHAVAKGKPTRAYVPNANDRPAAEFMFAELCADQERGSRGSQYPETLDVTGLVWPGAIDFEIQDMLK